MDAIISPLKTYVVRFSTYEVRMSHWINEPGIYSLPDNTLVFEMPSTWSADEVHWLDDSTVELKTRLYPGRVYCDLKLDLLAGTGTASRGSYSFSKAPAAPPQQFEGTLRQIINWL